MALEWSPIEVDRQIARAFAQWRAWRARSASSADPEDDPLAYFRPILGLSFFRQLGELPEADPLREPLRRWVYRLAEQRINHEALTDLALEWQRERPHPDTPGQRALSASQLRARALSDAPRRDLWLRLWFGSAEPISARVVTLWQRRSEVAQRMGLAAASDIESPAPGQLPAIARVVAERTRDRIRELGLRSPAAFVELALGRDIAGDWPGRLTPGRLLDYFRDGELLRSLELAPKALPPALGAASTCRALGQLGAAWFEALAARDQPFVVAHDPYGLSRHAAAALLSLLPLNPQFLSRKLQVPAHALPDAQRRLAQIYLLELARAALAVQLRAAAYATERTFREAFRELSARDLDLTLPPHLAGVCPSLGVEDEQRFAGLLLASERARTLCESHDEDWFRNPRAIEQLRAEAALPPVTSVAPDALERAAERSLRDLERLLR